MVPWSFRSWSKQCAKVRNNCSTGHFSGIHSTRPLPMPRPMPRFILNNIPASRQVCTAVDFSYSALRHALGPRDVRNLYRARATKDRKTSLVASCTWKQIGMITFWNVIICLCNGVWNSLYMHFTFRYPVMPVHKWNGTVLEKAEKWVASHLCLKCCNCGPWFMYLLSTRSQNVLRECP